MDLKTNSFRKSARETYRMAIIKEIQADLFKVLPSIDSEVTIVIPQCCNDIKLDRSGFIIPLFKAFPEAKLEYHKMSNIELGDVSEAWIERKNVQLNNPKYLIYNMIAQKGIKSESNPKPIKYAALVTCMEYVKNCLDYLENRKIEIHTCRFGSDRANGNFEFIKELIEEIWEEYPTYIYYL